jgi:hypothetical protein
MQPATGTSTQPRTSGGTSSAASIDQLADALGSEARLLEELVTIMRRQRDAVAVDDLQKVDDSVFATHRVLVTLGEARRRRRSLNRLLAGAEDVAVEQLDEALGPRMTDTVRQARDGLKDIARILSREVEMNRRVLRQALAAGEEFVRAICTPAEKPLYGSDARPATDRAAGGLLINRQA